MNAPSPSPHPYAEGMPADCPLPRAESCGGVVYMLAKSDPLTDEQFRSQAERNQALTVSGENVCTRFGLSVFTEVSGCTALRELRPRLGSLIVRADLKPEHGMIASTPNGRNPNHHTWWPLREIDRKSLFSVVTGV